MTFEELMKEVDERVHQPLVTARFGDKWKDHQKKLYDEAEIDFDTLLNIAWVQGRRALLLEQELRILMNTRIKGGTMNELE